MLANEENYIKIFTHLFLKFQTLITNFISSGEAFKRAGISIKHVYVSPSLRCVETAQGVINGIYQNYLRTL